MNKEVGRITYKSEQERLRKEYHLVFKRGTLVFEWRTQAYGNYRVTFGTNLEKAKAKALQWIAAIEAGIDPRIEEKNKTTSIIDFFTDALKNKKLRNTSANTVERYQNVEKNFLYWCALNKLKRIDEVTSKHMAQYFYDAATKPIVPNEQRKGVRAVRQNGASPKTLEFEKTYLKYVFQHAISEGLRTDNPVSGVIIKCKGESSITTESRAFHEHEIPLLLDAADKIQSRSTSFGNCTMREVLEFLFLTGLREGEMLHLQWNDVLWNDTENGSIKIEKKIFTEKIHIPFGNLAYQIFTQRTIGKAGHECVFTDTDLKRLSINSLPIRDLELLKSLRREQIEIVDNGVNISFTVVWEPKGIAGRVPLTSRAREILDTIAKRKDNQGYIFSGKLGGRIRVNLLPVLKEIMKQAGINKDGRALTIHSTRHTYGFRLRAHGIPLETIKELMRHSKLEDTEIYARYSIEEGAKAVQCLDYVQIKGSK